MFEFLPFASTKENRGYVGFGFAVEVRRWTGCPNFVPIASENTAAAAVIRSSGEAAPLGSPDPAVHWGRTLGRDVGKWSRLHRPLGRQLRLRARGPRIDCGVGHLAVMAHHRRMAFGFGTSVPTRGLAALIALRNGVGRVEGRARAEAKWLAAAVGTAVQRGGVVMSTGVRADCVGELRLPGIADHV